MAGAAASSRSGTRQELSTDQTLAGVTTPTTGRPVKSRATHHGAAEVDAAPTTADTPAPDATAASRARSRGRAKTSAGEAEAPEPDAEDAPLDAPVTAAAPAGKAPGKSASASRKRGSAATKTAGPDNDPDAEPVEVDLAEELDVADIVGDDEPDLEIDIVVLEVEVVDETDPVVDGEAWSPWRLSKMSSRSSR